jgi:hypothetical protein
LSHGREARVDSSEQKATCQIKSEWRVSVCIEQDIDLYSLQDILAGSNCLGRPGQSSDELSRGDRLYLAAVLACGILQFHGSRLKQQLGTRDVLFARDTPHGSVAFDHPYLVWPVSGPCTYNGVSPSTSNRIQMRFCYRLQLL